jgi:hypothetical protein
LAELLTLAPWLGEARAGPIADMVESLWWLFWLLALYGLVWPIDVDVP